MKLIRTVSDQHAGVRVDRFLAEVFDELSRSRIRGLIDQGCVTCADAVVAPDHKVAVGEEYVCVIPAPRPVADLEPEPIPLDVVYRDNDIIVVNKAPGMVVHPAPGHSSGTLVNALLYNCKELPVINGEHRPGIVHRLDKDTSGLIVAALNDRAMLGMQELFKSGTLKKIYAAIVRGVPPGRGELKSEIGRSGRDRKKMASVEKGGRYASTEYRLMEAFGNYSLIEVRIHTGRTHQIRVHMSEAGYPVAGDSQYGGRRSGMDKDEIAGFAPERQMLHSWKLGFRHPVSGKEMELEADFPSDFSRALGALRERGGLTRC